MKNKIYTILTAIGVFLAKSTPALAEEQVNTSVNVVTKYLVSGFFMSVIPLIGIVGAFKILGDIDPRKPEHSLKILIGFVVVVILVVALVTNLGNIIPTL